MTLLSSNAAGADNLLNRLPIGGVRVADRLRKLLPNRVATMAAMFHEQGQLTPIDVVATADGWRLIKGGIRIAAALQLGWTEIEAIVHPEGSFGSELDIRLSEISQTFVRFNLTALERAVYIAEWRAIHELKYPPAKPGPKSEIQNDDALEESSAKFALNFADTVQATLGLSRRAIFLDLKIASLPADIRDRIASLPVADKQSELLALASQPTGLLAQIVELLLAGAASVADAVATIEQRPLPSKLTPPERLSEGFARLTPDQKFAFFDIHAEAIDLWRAKRGKRK